MHRLPADSRVPLRHRRETATQYVHRGIDDDDNASDCACSAASDCDYSIAPGESLGPNAGGAEKATDPASPDVIASPAPLSSRPFLDLHSFQEAQPRHLHGDTRHCMPGGSASAFACQEAQPRHLHGETAIDDTSLVSFSSSLACPRGNRISGVNSSVDYPDEVRPLNLLSVSHLLSSWTFKVAFSLTEDLSSL